MTNFDYSRVVYTANKELRTADVLALFRGGDGWRVLLIVRGVPPHKGQYAAPGGFMENGVDATPAHTAARELEEETGLVAALPDPGDEERTPTSLALGKLAWLGMYNKPGRDPRFATASDTYVVLFNSEPDVSGGDDAEHAEFVPLQPLLDRIAAGETVLAFDHDSYLTDAVALLKELPLL